MKFPREGVCSIWLQGLELSDSVLRDVNNVSITFREGKAADGSMSIMDKDFRYMDSGLFIKNREIYFILGFTDDAVPLGPFIIKSYSIDAPEDATPVLTVEFQDLTHKLNKKKEKKRHAGGCDPFLKAMADAGELGRKVETPSGVKFDDEKALIQANKTKAAVINSLAERYGFIWGVKGKTLYFRRPNPLDEIGEQDFVPVLSYRTNDFSIQNFTADFKYSREKIKQGSGVVVENIDFESCEDLGSFIKEYRAGNIDLPKSVLAVLNSILPAGYHLDEDTNKGGRELTDTEKSVVDQLNKVLSAGGSKADAALAAMGENPEAAIEAGAKAAGISTGVSTEDPNYLITHAEETNSWTVDMFVEQAADKVKKILNNPNGLEELDEGGLKNYSGTASPANADEAEKQIKAVPYQTVVVCDATVEPTISSPRYQPSMSIILCGLGERLSGKYRVTEVALRYDHSGVFTSSVTCQKRYYGMTDKDKKRVSEATQAIENGDTKQSTPGGSDKTVPAQKWRVKYDPETNEWTEFYEEVTGES